MKAILLKTIPKQSHNRGLYYDAFFRGEDGKNYRSFLYPVVAGPKLSEQPKDYQKNFWPIKASYRQ